MTPGIETPHLKTPFTELIDLASETLGGKVLAANDEFFAAKENLIKDAAPVFIPGKFTDSGKWMDGWETRRRRTRGNDWCILQLGLPGIIHGVNVDTSHFLGNYPEYCSIDAASTYDQTGVDILSSETKSWSPILPKVKLAGGSANLFPIPSQANQKRWTHLRLNIFPDGGVARLRVHGDVVPDWQKVLSYGGPIDLASLENGGSVITCNDMFFGQKENLIRPGRAVNMGEGWETRRKRGPGYDWIIVKLGTPGRIQKVEIDTNHFKGNFPESCSLEACYLPDPTVLPSDFRDRTDIQWKEVLSRVSLQAHNQHFFDKELDSTQANEKFNYVRLNIFPDGGVSRLRIYGEPKK